MSLFPGKCWLSVLIILSIIQIPPVAIVLCPLGGRGAGSCQNACVVLLIGKITIYVKTRGDEGGGMTR